MPLEIFGLFKSRFLTMLLMMSAEAVITDNVMVGGATGFTDLEAQSVVGRLASFLGLVGGLKD